MNNKALCRKLEIEQHEIGCPGREAVSGPLVLVAPVV